MITIKIPISEYTLLSIASIACFISFSLIGPVMILVGLLFEGYERTFYLGIIFTPILLVINLRIHGVIKLEMHK